MVTSDGYILHLHRIANESEFETNETAENRTRTPVFLMHGLLETAASWIALGPEHSLGKKNVPINFHEFFFLLSIKCDSMSFSF